MNTRLHLTSLTAVFAFLTPATSILHAQMRTAIQGRDVPDGTRKCILPTFSAPLTVGTGSIDQPSIAVGNRSVWVDWNQDGSMVARGAPVTGLGVFGPFNAQQAIPSASGSFGGIAVGPGPNGGKVIVTYQSPTGGQGPATIYANGDADGLGAGGLGPRITVSATDVGGREDR